MVVRSPMRSLRLGVVLLVLVCASTSCVSTPKPLPKATVAPKAPIEFIEDDYARALAEARSTKRPMVIDAWAPWCHTCLSMRAYVFNDPALSTIAAKFVWLSIDTEKHDNAAFLERYPIAAWPTIWVVDSARETPVLKWEASATSAELITLLEDASEAIDHGGDVTPATASLLRGEAAAAVGKHDEALIELRAALASAPEGWPRRATLVDALTRELQLTKDFRGCVSLAVHELPDLPAGTARAMVALAGLACGRTLPKNDPLKQEVPVIANLVSRMAGDRSEQLLADDRSSLYEELVDFRRETGDLAGSKMAARAWASFLEDEAAHATTKEGRAVFDAHRLSAYIALGQVEKAIPMLKESEADFPADYNPPARLARADLELGLVDDALAAIDRALAKAYGPRKLRIYALKADILDAKGDKSAAKVTLQEAVKLGESMSLTGGYGKLLDELKKRLGA